MHDLINIRYLKAFALFLIVLFACAFIWNDQIVSFFLSYLLLYKYTTLFIIVFFAGLCVPIPMNILLMAVGALCIEGDFNFYWALVTASIANLIGDVVAVLIFRRYGHAILRDKYIEKYPFFLRLEAFFALHTNISIFVSRIIGIFGTPVNFLSGYMKIPVLQFALFDFIGNLAFAIVFLKLGFALGDRWLAVSDFVNTIMAIVAGILLFFIVTVLFYNHKKD